MEELTTILTEIRAGQDYSGAENFFKEGLLDSLDMTALVASLESRYNVFLDVDEIVPENLCNLKTIKTLLARKGVSL
jgi:acyl carrier protein